jgi:hypothetical protein
MKREFKFEVGQYVKIAEEILKANKDLPKYPCKITYRFFDGREISYIIRDDNGNEKPFIEKDLVPYTNDSNDCGTILEMQKEILALQQRITNLEFEVSKANREYKAFSLPGSVSLKEAIEQCCGSEAEMPEGE